MHLKYNYKRENNLIFEENYTLFHANKNLSQLI